MILRDSRSFTFLMFFVVIQFAILQAKAKMHYRDSEAQAWLWLRSDCQNCQISIFPKHEFADQINETTLLYLQALSSFKDQIVSIYKSDPQEYNLLAHMAVGILGRETNYGLSKRFGIKELPILGQHVVDAAKFLSQDEGANSRGLTQIKVVPAKIKEQFGITENDLNDPTKAAIATVGFLIESLQYLKNIANNSQLEFVKPETYVDYLPYVYIGRVKQLRSGNADPSKNTYIQEMKSHMKRFEVFEHPPSF